MGFIKQPELIALYLDTFTSVKSRDLNNAFIEILRLI